MNDAVSVKQIAMRPAGRTVRRLCIIGAFLSAVVAAEAAFIELQGDRRVEGTSVRRNADGDYVIQTPNGSRTYKAGQVIRAEGARPAEYDRAVGLAQDRQFDEAVPLLESIAQRYPGLGWDDRANMMLAKIHVSEGDFQRAVVAFDAMPDAIRARPDVEPVYWQALMETASFDRLEPLLSTAVRGASRDVAAQAQLMRGDMKMKRQQIEPAALDYLRTVILFDAVRSVQPEALYKAGKALQAMRHDKADEILDRLVQTYPDSPFTAKVQSE